MGKPSNSQTAQAQGTSAAQIVDLRAGQDELRATTSIKPSAKLESTSTLTASLTSRPASPSFESLRHDLLPASDDVTKTLLYRLPTLSTPKPPRTSGLQQSPAQSSVDINVDDDGDVFYDALDEFEEIIPTPTVTKRAAGIQQAPCHPEIEGRSKGRANGAANMRNARFSRSPCLPSATTTPGRGSSSSVASPGIFSTPLFAPLPPPPAPVSTGPTKRALLIGVNYNNSQDLKLHHANRDAVELGRVLSNVCQFPEENLLFVTDEARTSSNLLGAFATSGPVRGQVAAASDRKFPQAQAAGPQWEGCVHHEGKKRFVQSTRINVLEGFKWLTHGAKAGDELVMHFSGHCMYMAGQPYLLTTTVGAGCGHISKDDLRRELISKIPKDCRLTIVLDCCHSAAMVDLQYCIGNMRPKEVNIDSEAPQVTVVTATESNETTCAEDKPAIGPKYPLQTSLYGVQSGAVTQEPEPVIVAENPSPPGGFAAETFAPPPPITRANKRQGGVVAAPAPASIPAPARTSTATSWFPWITGTSTTTEPDPPPPAGEARSTAVTSAGVRWTRNCVVEAVRPNDHFAERKAGFDRPEGDVAVWAAAGADQNAYEASGGIRHGIVTGAFCKAIEACPGISLRDLWGYVQADVHSENELRRQRDQAKKKRPDPNTRMQHAELWVSQIQDLECTSRALDRSFCSGIVTGSRPRATPSPAAQACSEGVPDCSPPIVV